MPILCPALAYPHTTIDPCLDDPKRDDGETLLLRLRPVWRSLSRGDNAYLLDPLAPGCLGELIMGAKAESAATLLKALLESTAEKKPIVRLVAPSTHLISPEVMDGYFSQEQRVATIPVKGDCRCAVLDWPMRPPPKIIVIFEKNEFNKKGRHNAELEITREDDGRTINIHIKTFAGTSKRLKAMVHDSRLLDKAFDSSSLVLAADRALIPALPSELPATIQQEVADFWQTELRAHVLVAACQPCADAKSTRFLAFDKIVCTQTGKDAAAKRTTVRATLHASSAECICRLHGAKPMTTIHPKSRFVSSKVQFQISMCGRKLQRPSRGMEFGICPLHQGATPRVGLFPGICCHGTTADVSCGHFTDKHEFKPGVWLRSIPLDPTRLLHAQSLVAASIACTDATAPMVGKRKRDEIATVCDNVAQTLSSNLEHVNRLKTCQEQTLGAEELLRLDHRATELLRERKVRQYKRPSTKELVLAAPREDGTGGVVPLTGADRALNKAHLWMFAPR